jgi:hypothetical protein
MQHSNPDNDFEYHGMCCVFVSFTYIAYRCSKSYFDKIISIMSENTRYFAFIVIIQEFLVKRDYFHIRHIFFFPKSLSNSL